MSAAKQHGAKRTGRASLVRKFLGGQRTSKSAREILDAVEPGGSINLMTATLGTLLRSGAVEKHGAGLGQVRWQIARRNATSPKPAARAMKTSAVATQKAKPAVAESASKKVTRSAPTPKVSKTIVQPTRKSRVEQKTNFAAPLSTVKAVAKPSATAGFETVDDFLRRGGRIQVLRPGECSQPLQYDHSHYAEQRAKGRTTQQRTRANKGA
jgi:hypothetical protein